MRKEITVDHPDEVEIHGQEEEQIYPMSRVKVDKGFYTVFELKRRYDAPERRIILDADFQREDVWKLDRKAELIESVLMGLPLPVFYFNQDKFGRLIVVDGRQRLTALFDYMNDKYALSKLRILPDLNGVKFSGLSPVLAGRLEDFQIQAHVILPPTPDRVKFDIFDRVNRGGMQLNKQEIRNALYQGKSTCLLNELVRSDEFYRATGGAFRNEKRMKDKYLLTRYIVFYLYRNGFIKDEDGKEYIYREDIDELLGKGMDALNGMGNTELAYIEKAVREALDKSAFYLGGDAFRLQGGERRTPINMNVFETVMFVMQHVSGKESRIRNALQSEVSRLINSERFRENIGDHRDSVSKLKWRLDSAEKLGEKFS